MSDDLRVHLPERLHYFSVGSLSRIQRASVSLVLLLRGVGGEIVGTALEALQLVGFSGNGLDLEFREIQTLIIPGLHA